MLSAMTQADALEDVSFNASYAPAVGFVSRGSGCLVVDDDGLRACSRWGRMVSVGMSPMGGVGAVKFLPDLVLFVIWQAEVVMMPGRLNFGH